MKKKKIRRIKISRLIIAINILLILSLSVWYIFGTRINAIYINGNYLLTEQKILEQAKIDNYPSFCLTSRYEIKKALLKNELIKNISVSKKIFLNSVSIEIEEFLPLFIKKENNKLVLSNKNEIDYQNIMVSVPTLINYIPDTKYDKFIQEMSLIDKSILNKISEIEYLPNEYDKERFLLYMADTNQVYLTLTKFNKINNYDAILLELNNIHGILYLDSGNHFQKYP